MTTTPPEPDQPFGTNQPAYPGSQPDGSYPQHPGFQPPQGGTGAAPDKPSSIATAVKLMLTGAALSLISLIISFATFGSLKDDISEQLREDDPSVTQSTIDAAFAIGIAFAVIIGLIGALAWVWMAWKNGQGRSWARVVATVLGGLNVLFTLLGFATANAEPITLVFSLINLALAVVILILLWRPESTRFYEDVSRSRQLR